MNFTIFTPTRGRVHLLKEGLDKIQENTKFLDKIEAIYAVDDDDTETIKFFFHNKDKYEFPIKYFIGPRPESLNAAINFLAKEARGQYLQNYNDDALIVTKDWDEIILNKINEFKSKNNIEDDIIYVKTGCNSVDKDTQKNYSSFPVISKQAVGILDYFMREIFRGLGADAHVFRLYDSIKRVVNCEEIQYDHVYHSSIFAVNAPDSTAHTMRQRSWANPVDPHGLDISEDVKKLQDFISSYKLFGPITETLSKVSQKL